MDKNFGYLRKISLAVYRINVPPTKMTVSDLDSAVFFDLKNLSFDTVK